MSDRNTNSEVVELKGDGNPPECVYPTSYGVPPNDVMQSPRNRNQFDVLVTNGWGRIAYNIVRSLGRRGLGIALGTDEFLGMALLSRYTTAHFHHPSIRNTAGFIESLKQAFRTFAPRVYLPSEQEVLVVSRFRDELDEYGVKIPIAPFETLCALHKKDALTDLAASLGVPTPETIVPKDLADVRAFAREIGDPVVVKRLCSSSGRGVFYTTREKLLADDGASALRGLPFGKFLLQRYVGGTGCGVSMLFNHGQLRAKFTHKRLRERLSTGGVSTLRMSVQNRLLEEYAERLLRHTCFHGVAMVEFKYDEASNQAWLLEVNPRFWGSLALAIHSGVDFPHLVYRMALEGDVEPVLNYQTNVQGRWIMGDMFTVLLRMGRNGHQYPTTAEHPSARAFDDLDWRDPLPFAGQFIFSAWKYLITLNASPEDAEILPETL